MNMEKGVGVVGGVTGKEADEGQLMLHGRDWEGWGTKTIAGGVMEGADGAK